jgi:hypothetical protein
MRSIFTFIEQIADIVEKIHLTRIAVITSRLTPYEEDR